MSRHHHSPFVRRVLADRGLTPEQVRVAAEIGTSTASIDIVSFSAAAAAWAAATQLAAAALVVVACVRACPPTATTSPSASQS